MARYILLVCAVNLILYLIPFFVARSAFYEHRSLSYYSRPLNYAFETPVRNADVVLFGDSTVLLGVDPSQMAAALGANVVNLPNTHGSLMVDNDLALRRYLASNLPPKLIVFYFAPWDFDYGNAPFDAAPVFEGEELLARQGTIPEIIAFTRRHPADTALFPLRFYANIGQFLSHKVSHQGQEETLAATHGHIENTDSSVLADPCSFPPLLLDNVRFDWVKELAAKYSSSRTRILFFVAPVPSCTNVAALLDKHYDRLPAGPPVQLPPAEFVRDIRYIHPHPDAVTQLTRNLTDAVRPALAPLLPEHRLKD